MHDVGEYGMPYEDMKKILRTARKTYGNRNQLLVSIEELNELACVLAKYPRYEDDKTAVKELYDKALDEVADVYTILEHVKAIFGISEEALWRRRTAKAVRLQRWMSNSSSMVETTKDRAVESESTSVNVCKTCKRELTTEETWENYCRPCFQAQATEGIAINKE